MIAEKVNDNIQPGQITIDNINEKTLPSQNAIRDLNNADIPSLITKINEFNNKQMRFFGKQAGIIEIDSPEKGMAYFIEI